MHLVHFSFPFVRNYQIPRLQFLKKIAASAIVNYSISSHYKHCIEPTESFCITLLSSETGLSKSESGRTNEPAVVLLLPKLSNTLSFTYGQL